MTVFHLAAMDDDLLEVEVYEAALRVDVEEADGPDGSTRPVRIEPAGGTEPHLCLRRGHERVVNLYFAVKQMINLTTPLLAEACQGVVLSPAPDFEFSAAR